MKHQMFWQLLNVFPHGRIAVRSHDHCNHCSSWICHREVHQLHQHCRGSKPNTGSLFTDKPALVSQPILTPPLAKVHHSLVIVDLDAKLFPNRSPTMLTNTTRSTGMYLKVIQQNMTPSSNSHHSQTPNPCWMTEKNLRGLAKTHIPVKRVNGKKPKPWITPKVKGTLRSRDRAHTNWRSSQDPKRWNLYFKRQSTEQKMLRQAFW